MNNSKKVLWGIVIVIVLILGVTFPRGNSVVKQIVGAVPVLDGIDSPWVSIGGVKQYYYSQSMTATSAVVCSLKNPFGATSTLLRYGVSVTSNGIGVAQTVEVSTSTTNGTPTSTSSPAYVKAFAAGAGQFSFVWNPAFSTTSTLLIGNAPGNVGNSNNVLGPSDYINFVISTGTPGTFSTYYGGRCTGVLQRL